MKSTSDQRRTRCHLCRRREVKELVAGDPRFLQCTRCMAIQLADSEIEPLLGIPDGVTIERAPRVLILTVRWRRLAHFLFAFLATGWLLLSLAFTFGWVLNGQAPAFNWNLLPLSQVILASGTLYWCVGGLVNSTTILAGEREITVTHGPLPWIGNRVIVAEEIKRFYTIEIPEAFSETRVGFHHSKQPVDWTYPLLYRIEDGTHHTLVAGIPLPDHAYFLQRALERFYGGDELADEPPIK